MITYHQRLANTAAIPYCGASAPPERTLNSIYRDLPAGARACLRCIHRLERDRVIKATTRT